MSNEKIESSKEKIKFQVLTPDIIESIVIGDLYDGLENEEATKLLSKKELKEIYEAELEDKINEGDFESAQILSEKLGKKLTGMQLRKIMRNISFKRNYDDYKLAEGYLDKDYPVEKTILDEESERMIDSYIREGNFSVAKKIAEERLDRKLTKEEYIKGIRNALEGGYREVVKDLIKEDRNVPLSQEEKKKILEII